MNCSPSPTLVTPNLDEAAALLGEPIPDLAALRTAGARLATSYGVPMLLKGGHLAGDIAVDLLCQNGGITEFSAPFVRGVPRTAPAALIPPPSPPAWRQVWRSRNRSVAASSS